MALAALAVALALTALALAALALAASALVALTLVALARLAARALAAPALALLLLAGRDGLVVGLSKARGWAGDQKSRATCHQQVIEPHGYSSQASLHGRLRCSNDAAANSILTTSKSVPWSAYSPETRGAALGSGGSALPHHAGAGRADRYLDRYRIPRYLWADA